MATRPDSRKRESKRIMGQRERVKVIAEYLIVEGIWIELASGTGIEKNREAQAAVNI